MEASTIKPIRRIEALVNFSREHHFALLMIWKIRQGIKNNIDAGRISRFAVYYFDKALRRHFVEEESGIFSDLAPTDRNIKQAMREHDSIYSLVNKLEDCSNDYVLLNSYANMLESHIRFEERTLFNSIQENIVQRQSLHKPIPTFLTERLSDDDWEDKFWLSNTITHKVHRNENSVI